MIEKRKFHVFISSGSEKEKFLAYLKDHVIPFAEGIDEKCRSRYRIDFKLTRKETEMISLGILQRLKLPLIVG